MGTIAITGAASGIGAATRARLEAEGHRVIGIDLRDADVVADLGTPDGRQAMVDGVTALAGGVLDGLVAAAGVMGASENTDLVVRVNYFGAIATLVGLRPLLAAAPAASAVALSSNSATAQPALGDLEPLVDTCLAGDEAAALDAARGVDGLFAYPVTKLALARWVRREATSAAWIGEGVRLNAIAPGFVSTPMTAGHEEFILGLGDVFPIPVGRPGRAEEIAGLITFLLGPDAGFFCGSFITVDGGTEAALRPDDWPRPIPG